MKRNNKILVIILLTLLSAFILTKLFRAPSLESNLDTDAFALDTARVSAFSFRSVAQSDDEIILKKSDSAWIVQQGSQTAKARTFDRKQFFRTVSKLKPERMVSRKKEKWHNYQVTDTTAIRVTAYDNQNPVAEWLVGREAQGLTYFRRAGEEEVYAMEGNLRNTFDKTFNEWRDKTFLNVEGLSVEKITFHFPADSGYVLARKGTGWTIGGEKADSSRVASFLNQLRLKELTQVEEGFTPEGDAPFVVRIAAQTGGIAEVRGWRRDEQWILSSTQLENVYFKERAFARDIFRGKGWFLK